MASNQSGGFVGETLRIGFIGGGNIARAHAVAIRALVKQGFVDARITGVHDRDPVTAAQFAEWNRASVSAGPSELAAGSDVVYVCTSTGGHAEAVEAAVTHRCPTFVEKPLARTLAEAEEIASLVRGANVPSQVGLVLRTAPVFRALAAMVEAGTYGRPMAVVFRDDQFFPIQGHYASTWRADVRIAGAGALLEHSIHDLDILRMCFGEVAGLSATTGNFAGHEGIEDVAVGTLRLGSGTLATLVSVWHNVLTRPSTRRIETIFEDGFVSFDDDFTGPLTIQTSSGTEVRACAPPGWVADLPLPPDFGLAIRPYVEENRAYLDAVVEGRAPEPGLDEALAAHRIVDAWYRSAAAAGASIDGPW
jgi:UDP-N-acetylglucosamine 3-dehydrogenase